MLGPDSLEGTETPGSLNVANNSDSNNWRSLDDGNTLNNLFLVALGAGSVDLPDDVTHTSLVTHEAGQMDWLGGIILREGLSFTPHPLRSLLGEESLGTMTGCFELSVRHFVSEHKLMSGIKFPTLLSYTYTSLSFTSLEI